MISKTAFVGSWVSSLPFDSDDYLIKYDISLHDGTFVIKARDLQDGEKIKISDIRFRGGILQFLSYVPSTKRKGINKLKIVSDERMEAEFTFTVIEELRRFKKSQHN
jgi:hypothetical protein